MNAQNFTPRELACVLAALRFWQVRNLPRLKPGQRGEIEKISLAAGPSLDCEEIDALCERLNVAKPKTGRRFVGTFYNNSGACAFLPIKAASQREAERIADGMAEKRQPGSGGTEFVADVRSVDAFARIAENAAKESKPYTKKDA